MRPTSARPAPMLAANVALLAASLAAGLSWHIGTFGPFLSPALAFLAPLASTRRLRFLVAAAYFAGGEVGGPLAVTGFFGPGHLALGVGLWLATVALLAAPWVFAHTWRGVLFAVAVEALPPLGLIGWLSPLTATGAFFPGAGWGGLGLTLLLLLALAVARPRPQLAAGTLLALAVLAVTLNTASAPLGPPTGWAGVNTNVGPVPTNALQAVARNEAWIQQAHLARSSIAVLPEAIAGDWGAGTFFQINSAGLAPGQRWLVGANIRAGKNRWNGLVLVGDKHATLAFRQLFPIPLTMWRPWSADSYTPAWWGRTRMIDGRRTWAAICYDQVLVWPWLEALWQRPAVIVAVSNGWWAPHTGIPTIQRAAVWAWTRLLGAQLVEARNR